MLSDLDREILNFLKTRSSEWTRSNDLANYFHCTTRTIRNRVNKINELRENNIIVSSNKGYKIVGDVDDILISKNEYEERKIKIFFNLLKEGEIDINSLSRDFYVSYSTVKSDIYDLKKFLSNKNIEIILSGDKVFLKGKEQDKRKFMMELLYQEENFQNEVRNSIQENLVNISLNDLEEIIRQNLEQYDFMCNQFFLDNLVLHYAVSISRIKDGNTVKEVEIEKQQAVSTELELSDSIARDLFYHFNISLSTDEINHFSMLFLGHQRNYDILKINHYVENKILNLTKKVLMDVKNVYLIDIYDDELITRLSIHIQALINRLKYDRLTRNSSLVEIKMNYPLIYDIAVFISATIQKELDVWFDENEISFIALHIGSFLENKKSNEDIISVGVDIVDYYELQEQMILKLKKNLDSNVVINSHEKGTYYDLLLTTNKNQVFNHPGAIFVSPLLTQYELNKIKKRIEEKRLLMKQTRLMECIGLFIREDLFFSQIDTVKLTPKKIRNEMVSLMEEKGIVNKDYRSGVELREKMSPTSFPTGVAIPHSLKLDGNEQLLSIMTLQEHLQWSDYRVKLIILTSDSKKQSPLFNEFFGSLIEILSDSVNVKILSNSLNYEAFISNLKLMFLKI